MEPGDGDDDAHQPIPLRSQHHTPTCVEGTAMSFRLPLGVRIGLWTGIPLAFVTGLAGFMEFDRTKHEARDNAASVGADFLEEFGRRVVYDVILEDDDRLAAAFEDFRNTLPELRRGRITVDGHTVIDWEPASVRGPLIGIPQTLSHELSKTGDRHGRVVISIDESRFAPTLARRREQILFHTIMTQVALAIICATVGHSLARRIRVLAAQSHRISEGNFSTSAPEGSDELGRVGEAFNRMAREIERQQYRLAESRDTAVAAASHAQKATAAKSEFLANMSHEIRTPLNAVLGFGEQLLDPEISVDDRRASADAIIRNGKHLLNLINDILDFSKIEAGHMDAEKQRVNVPSLARETVSLLKGRADAKGLTLDLVMPPQLPETIETDPTRLRQILLNLIGNAIKFTERGSVTLEVGDVIPEQGGVDGQLSFSVKDSGIGIEPETLSKLFQPFTQADSTMTRRFGGTGLGLSISRRLSNLLGGKISVESKPGQGSTFRSSISTGSLIGIPWVNTSRSNTPRVEPVATLPSFASGARILVAEDGPDNQELFRLILEKAGAEVTIVENGRLAIDAVHTAETTGEPFDLLVLDMQMPELDGYAAATQLRAMGYELPIIAVTAHALDSDRKKCIAAGCDDYESKPIVRKRFLETLERNFHKTVAE